METYKERLKSALNDRTTDYEVVRWIEQNFPELKESEDERIRKSLIGHLKECRNNTRSEVMIGEYAKWIAWLEKQGEQKPTDKVEPKFKIGDTVKSTFSGIQYYITDVHDYYYTTDTGCVIMFNSQDNFELSEQNHAWSEEDNIILSRIIADYERSNEEWFNAQKSLPHGRKITWLKSLKDRVQPQSHWKPSEQDILLLEKIFDGKIVPRVYQVTLQGIIEQLKKLREE